MYYKTYPTALHAQVSPDPVETRRQAVARALKRPHCTRQACAKIAKVLKHIQSCTITRLVAVPWQSGAVTFSPLMLSLFFSFLGFEDPI